MLVTVAAGITSGKLKAYVVFSKWKHGMEKGFIGNLLSQEIDPSTSATLMVNSNCVIP